MCYSRSDIAHQSLMSSNAFVSSSFGRGAPCPALSQAPSWLQQTLMYQPTEQCRHQIVHTQKLCKTDPLECVAKHTKAWHWGVGKIDDNIKITLKSLFGQFEPLNSTSKIREIHFTEREKCVLKSHGNTWLHRSPTTPVWASLGTGASEGPIIFPRTLLNLITNVST